MSGEGDIDRAARARRLHKVGFRCLHGAGASCDRSESQLRPSADARAARIPL